MFYQANFITYHIYLKVWDHPSEWESVIYTDVYYIEDNDQHIKY